MTDHYAVTSTSWQSELMDQLHAPIHVKEEQVCSQQSMSSQDSGISVKSESGEYSWSEDLENTSVCRQSNSSTVSCDSGYMSNCPNLSMNSTLTAGHDDYEILGTFKPEIGADEPFADSLAGKMTETQCHPSLEPLFSEDRRLAGPGADSVFAEGWQNVRVGPHGVTQQIITVQKPANLTGAPSATPRSAFGFYAQNPVYIQPKPSDNSIVYASTSAASKQTVNNSNNNNNNNNTRKKPIPRVRKVTAKVEEYEPIIVTPSPEMNAARRLLDEALITGNIVSQARYARINKKLQAMRMKAAQRSSIIQSFTNVKEHKSNPSVTTGAAAAATGVEKRVRINEPANRKSVKSSRVVYQENQRLEGECFSWKVGYNAPYKSFKNISVKKGGRKKRRHAQQRPPFTDLSGDSDDCNLTSSNPKVGQSTKS